MYSRKSKIEKGFWLRGTLSQSKIIMVWKCRVVGGTVALIGFLQFSLHNTIEETYRGASLQVTDRKYWSCLLFNLDTRWEIFYKGTWCAHHDANTVYWCNGVSTAQYYTPQKRPHFGPRTTVRNRWRNDASVPDDTVTKAVVLPDVQSQLSIRCSCLPVTIFLYIFLLLRLSIWSPWLTQVEPAGIRVRATPFKISCNLVGM